MRKLKCCLFCLFILLLFSFGRFVCAEDISSRYTVLIMDTSGSMDGDSLVKAKEAMLKFYKDAQGNKNVNNYIAAVGFDFDGYLISDFATPYDQALKSIKGLNAAGSTNFSSAFEIVESLLDSKGDKNTKKSIVLFSDGLPEFGGLNYDGPYEIEDSRFYDYCNYMYHYAKQLRDKEYDIYTLGFFDSLNDTDKPFAKQFMMDLAGGSNRFYDINDVNDIVFKFDEVKQDIDKKGDYVSDNKGINFRSEFSFFDDSENKIDISSNVFYDDAYFLKDSYIYNPSLATASLGLAMTSFVSNNIKISDKDEDYKESKQNVEFYLKNLGFSNIYANASFSEKPKSDSIGVIVGSKDLKDSSGNIYKLIAIGVRGAGYEREWMSNVTMGKDGFHEGFLDARNKVIEFLNSYISKYAVSGNVKFWISGFSRAAATSNLVAGYLDDNKLNNISYTPSDVYAYTFETPAGYYGDNCKNSKYNNIFNIINPSDIVPKVAPSIYGFSRYGVDKYIYSELTNKSFDILENKMLNQFYKLLDDNKQNNSFDYKTKNKYLINQFSYKFIPIDSVSIKVLLGPLKYLQKRDYNQAKLLDDYIIFLSKNVIKNRNNYVNKYQNDIRFYYDSRYDNVLNLEDAKNDFDKYSRESLLLSLLIKLKLDKAVSVYMLNDVFTDIFYILKNELLKSNLSDTINVLLSIDSIAQAHYPELCLAWLRLADPNFNGGQEINIFNNGGYRFIHINCPVDVHVYDESHTLVASIENEQPKEISSLVAGIDADGQKYVILPNTDDYTIEIKAREDTKTNYGVDEYSALAGEYTRFVNYFDVDMKKDEVITASVPKQSQEELDSSIPDGSNQVYTLSQNGNNLQATSDLKGDAAKNAYYDIEVVSEDENKGMTSGNVFKAYGQFVEIQAEAKEGYQFMGWFVDNQKVSDQTTYRIRIEKPLKYVAKFENKKDSTTSSSSQSSKTTGSTNDTTQSSNLIEKQANQKVNKKKSTFMNAGMKFMPYVAIGLGLIGVSVFLIHFNRKKK